jgi:hypothetical protein
MRSVVIHTVPRWGATEVNLATPEVMAAVTRKLLTGHTLSKRAVRCESLADSSGHFTDSRYSFRGILYSWSYIIRRSDQGESWGHMARVGKTRDSYTILTWIHKGRDRLGHLNLDGRAVLRWTWKKVVVRILLNLSFPVLGQVASCCERGNENTGCVRSGQFFFPFGSRAQFRPWPPPWNFPFHFSYQI